jgi:hypothetical protein
VGYLWAYGKFGDRAPFPVERELSILETVVKTLIASIFSLSLLAATAASAQVGVGVNVLGVGVGAHVGAMASARERMSAAWERESAYTATRAVARPGAGTTTSAIAAVIIRRLDARC